VVVRSTRELRAGDRLYYMACMSRLVVAGQDGRLEALVVCDPSRGPPGKRRLIRFWAGSRTFLFSSAG
jgi:hypothetical protein